MVGREEERKRISKDLHDDLGATITGAKMFLQGIQGKSDMDNLNISKAHGSVSQCMILVRQIMNDLYPVSLDTYGLVSGISEFIEEINQKDKLNILFSNNVNDLEAKIPKDHKIHLFRIIKEIIQNTIKHSKSKVIAIQFSETSNLIILDTVDEGIGFDGNSNSYLKKSHGIRNIINRVELIGGILFLDARINKGVQYTIEIPVNATTKN